LVTAIVRPNKVDAMLLCRNVPIALITVEEVTE